MRGLAALLALLSGCSAHAPWPSLAAAPDLAGATLARGGAARIEVQIAADGSVGGTRLLEIEDALEPVAPRLEDAARRWRFPAGPPRTARLRFRARLLPGTASEADLAPRFLPPDVMEVRLRVP